MNHYENFGQFIRKQKWMSKEFGDILIFKLNFAMQDAYKRGTKNALQTHICHIDDPLTKKKIRAMWITKAKKKLNYGHCIKE